MSKLADRGSYFGGLRTIYTNLGGFSLNEATIPEEADYYDASEEKVNVQAKPNVASIGIAMLCIAAFIFAHNYLIK